MTAALQGKTVKEVLFQQRKPNKREVTGLLGNCYGYGQMGHRIRQCPNKDEAGPPSESFSGWMAVRIMLQV